MTHIQTVLCPTDFSPHAEAAFGLACSLARDYGAKLVVLHVVPPPVVYGEGLVLPPVALTEDLRRQLQQVRPAGAKPTVEHHLADGDAADEIVRQAKESKCDLIVMGTHGRTGLGRLVMGSIAEKVVCRAPCPVLTVKLPAAQATAAPPKEEPAHA
jgi:universal stress protein A